MKPVGVDLCRRIAAGCLLAVALISLGCTLFGLYTLWTARQAAVDQVVSGVVVAKSALAKTHDGLTVLDKQLATAAASLAAGQHAARSSGEALDTTRTLLTSTSVLLREEVPDTIGAAQQALLSGQSAARLIDDVLTALSRISLYAFDYRPEVPLNVALGNVAVTLEKLPVLLAQHSRRIDSASDQLPTVAQKTRSLADALESSRVELTEAHSLVDEGKGAISRCLILLDDLEGSLLRLLTWLWVAITFVGIWLALVQVGAMMLAVRWLRRQV